jgi:hypothetical protein
MLPTDWSRLEFYGRRIRVLRSINADAEILEENVFHFLAAYRPARSLLPRLQRLSLSICDVLAPSIPYMDCFLGPTIIHISITIKLSETDAIALFFPTVARLCPNIQDFAINVQELQVALDPTLKTSVFQAASNMHNLRDVDFSMLEIPKQLIHPLILHLGTLPSLTRFGGLRLPGLKESDVNLLQFPKMEVWFPKLTIFTLLVQDFKIASVLLDSMRLPYRFLAIFQISTRTLLPLDSFRRLIRSLASNSNLESSLESLLIDGTISVPKNDAEVKGLFQPLLKLKSLSSFTLAVSGTEKLDDAWLSQAAESFPLLEDVELRSSISPQSTKMTLAGFMALLRHCPRLREIAISAIWKPFDTEEVLVGDERLFDNQVTKISTRESLIIQPVASIFRCLVMMFPRLKDLKIKKSFASTEEKQTWLTLRQLVRDSRKY